MIELRLLEFLIRLFGAAISIPALYYVVRMTGDIRDSRIDGFSFVELAIALLFIVSGLWILMFHIERTSAIYRVAATGFAFFIAGMTTVIAHTAYRSILATGDLPIRFDVNHHPKMVLGYTTGLSAVEIVLFVVVLHAILSRLSYVSRLIAILPLVVWVLVAGFALFVLDGFTALYASVAHGGEFGPLVFAVMAGGLIFWLLADHMHDCYTAIIDSAARLDRMAD